MYFIHGEQHVIQIVVEYTEPLPCLYHRKAEACFYHPLLSHRWSPCCHTSQRVEVGLDGWVSKATHIGGANSVTCQHNSRIPTYPSSSPLISLNQFFLTLWTITRIITALYLRHFWFLTSSCTQIDTSSVWIDLHLFFWHLWLCYFQPPIGLNQF